MVKIRLWLIAGWACIVAGIVLGFLVSPLAQYIASATAITILLAGHFRQENLLRTRPRCHECGQRLPLDAQPTSHG